VPSGEVAVEVVDVGAVICWVVGVELVFEVERNR